MPQAEPINTAGLEQSRTKADGDREARWPETYGLTGIGRGSTRLPRYRLVCLSPSQRCRRTRPLSKDGAQIIDRFASEVKGGKAQEFRGWRGYPSLARTMERNWTALGRIVRSTILILGNIGEETIKASSNSE